ncbi:MAG: nitrilase family protein [Saprospiraceae bacterium]|nr:nitrilase family protein [Saprospiraceae bacterium]
MAAQRVLAMRVTLLQYATSWMALEDNLQQISLICQSASGNTDLLVLPEMFNTGYTMSPDEIPYEWQNITISRLQYLSAQFDLAISGSIPMFKDGKWYNTFITVNASGLIHHYDKIHLFTLAGEKKVYQSGNKSTYFEINKWQILPLICYDLRFPYLSFTNKFPDIIIYSANWPIARVHHWKSLLIARAIENQCFVIGVNRTGMDENGYHYPGNSMIVDFNGTVIGELDDQPSSLTLSLDKAEMYNFRKKLPFLQDRST